MSLGQLEFSELSIDTDNGRAFIVTSAHASIKIATTLIEGGYPFHLTALNSNDKTEFKIMFPSDAVAILRYKHTPSQGD